MRCVVAAIASLALAACVTEDADVLVDGQPLTSCDQVAQRTSDDQACTFTGVCALAAPTDPVCCQVLASCAGGTLRLDRYCEPGCAECADDTQCVAGATLCEANRCVACPDPSTCAAWPCPPGLVPLVRNGCETCTCAPPSECGLDPTQCMGEACYPGMVCAPGCAPGDPSCCANVCAPPGCASPAPLGCDTTCPPAMGCPDDTCVTGACECMGDTWVCTPVCGPRSGICFQPT